VPSTLRDAANVLRTRLLSNEITPALFRSKLAEVPPREREGWLDLLWDLDEIPDDDVNLPRGCVPYLPCSVTTVSEAVELAQVTPHDLFVDVGSGTGRTAFLVRLLTGAACIGLEIQPGLVEAARARAAWLNLPRTRFVEGDAADLVRCVPVGTVFFLYCPFGGERLQRVLAGLEDIARTRQIRVCCVDMPLLERRWLARIPSTPVNLHVYRSTLPHHATRPFESATAPENSLPG
jgi:SAM-dependent methyltransferase